jgi:DNA-binding Xre family transcriptional regulator
MDVLRLRLPELLTERGMTAYEVAKLSNGRLRSAVLYRIAARNGAIRLADLELLDALADTLGVEPGELLTRDPPPEPEPPPKRARGKR